MSFLKTGKTTTLAKLGRDAMHKFIKHGATREGYEDLMEDLEAIRDAQRNLDQEVLNAERCAAEGMANAIWAWRHGTFAAPGQLRDALKVWEDRGSKDTCQS